MGKIKILGFWIFRKFLGKNWTFCLFLGCLHVILSNRIRMKHFLVYDWINCKRMHENYWLIFTCLLSHVNCESWMWNNMLILDSTFEPSEIWALLNAWYANSFLFEWLVLWVIVYNLLEIYLRLDWLVFAQKW